MKVDDVPGVEAMGDAALIEDDQATVGKHIQCSTDDNRPADLDLN